MGGERPQASPTNRAAPTPDHPRHPAPVIPLRPLRPSCAGRNPRARRNFASPQTSGGAQPSPRQPVRMSKRASNAEARLASCLRRNDRGRVGRAIGTRTPSGACWAEVCSYSRHPFPNSSLPPSRGEVRWGVRGRKPAHQPRCPPDHPRDHPRHLASVIPLPLPSSPAPPPSFLRRQEPTRTTNLPPPPTSGGAEAALADRRDGAACTDAGGRLASCLLRNDGSVNSPYSTPSQRARSSARQSYSTRMSSPKTSCARPSES